MFYWVLGTDFEFIFIDLHMCVIYQTLGVKGSYFVKFFFLQNWFLVYMIVTSIMKEFRDHSPVIFPTGYFPFVILFLQKRNYFKNMLSHFIARLSLNIFA